MLSLLERFSTPVAAFAVLRSVPLLIRQQGSDGYWDESRSEPLIQPGGKPCPWSPVAKETSTFMVLRALRKFGFLDRLRPD